MANNNPPRNAKSAAAKPSSQRSVFIGVLIAIVVVGGAAIAYLMKNPSTGDNGATAQAAYDSLQANYKNAGPAKPYVMGNPKAPVVIEEFADFECPVCGNYATVTEPDVRKQIVDAGLAYYKYYDFPLPMHHNTQFASNAAACADEQGKFWEMHDQLYAGQDSWGLNSDGATQVTDNPKSIFVGYASKIGLNAAQFEKCYDSRKYQSRVDANTAEGFKRGVNQTPTFFINGTKMPGALPYDMIKSAVDAAAATAATAAPAAAKPPAGK
ncbi:MAG: thioredoxin domain-containing protein [Gemmatimonadaceae bacterium]